MLSMPLLVWLSSGANLLPWWGWLLVGCMLGLLLARSGFRLDRPLGNPRLQLADLPHCLDGFFQQMAPGAVFHLSRNDGPGFLQLVLVRRGPSGEAVEFGLPESVWSAPHISGVYRALRAAGYDCRIETETAAGGPRFLRVQLEGMHPELGAAAARLLQVAATALGFAREENYTLRMWGPISAEHALELANQLKCASRGGRVWRRLAAGRLRRRLERRDD
jgi:hypothetical protein